MRKSILRTFSTLQNKNLLRRTFSHFSKLEKEQEIVSSVLISNDLREKLKRIFLRNSSPYDKREEHLLFSYQKVVSALPPAILASIRDFKCRVDASPVLLIRNLPTDDNLTETPHDAKRSLKKTSFISESCLTGFSQILGDVYGYVDEKEGELIHNICPVKSQEANPAASVGSTKPFPLHVEYGYCDFRPEYLSLYCLRSDHDQRAATIIVCARDLVEKLASEDIGILKKPLFRTPYFKKINGRTFWSRPRPILFGSDSNPDIVLHLSDEEMQALTEDAKRVFETLKEKILTSIVPSHSIKLKPGDLMFINNRKVAHGRSEFTPRYDGKDRWLQRAYVTNKLRDGHSEEQAHFRIVIGEKASIAESSNKEFKLLVEVPPKLS